MVCLARVRVNHAIFLIARSAVDATPLVTHSFKIDDFTDLPAGNGVGAANDPFGDCLAPEP